MPVQYTSVEQSLLEICRHDHVDIRYSACSNGVIQYVKQCLTCGEKVGSAIKHADVIAARGDLRFIAPLDEEFRETQREKRRAERRAEYSANLQQREAERLAERQTRKAEFDASYGEYLQTAQWRDKRELVIQRAGGICEGCRSRKASVVHHLTYDHVGNELLFELVALCRPCHDKCHGVIQ